jgi:hypothetical protein
MIVVTSIAAKPEFFKNSGPNSAKNSAALASRSAFADLAA